MNIKVSLYIFSIIFTFTGNFCYGKPNPADSVQAKKAKESDFYQIKTLPIPDGITLEVGGMVMTPDGKLGVSTRRGDIWVIENPTMEHNTSPYYRLFARGLHEPLGLAYKDGSFYAAQRGELTRLTDENGDGKADAYEAVYSWPLTGNYHEYSYGPVVAPDGSMFITANLGFFNPEWWLGRSKVPWRGWTFKISPEGELEPFAAGMRSPAGMAINTEGDLFYAENQGDWIGSGGITHLEKGNFAGGNPASLAWAQRPESPVKITKEQIVSSDSPMFQLAEKHPSVKTPSVWIPHGVLGISNSGIIQDDTKGKFGPFENQLLVGDQGQSRIMRVALEKVNGVYQGAVFPFLEGFSSGVFRFAWGQDGSLLVGMTNRGWSSTGQEPFGLQRVVWSEEMPFEIKTIAAMPDGFELEFTAPVDKQMAGDIASYAVSSFTYQYHWEYGSPTINAGNSKIKAVLVSDDGLKARLVVDTIRKGYIHEVKAPGVISKDGYALLHDAGYYTLNQIPDGDKVKVEEKGKNSAVAAHAGHGPSASAGNAPAHTTAISTTKENTSKPKAVPSNIKRMTEMPAYWGKPDEVITVGTKPGLKFDKTLIEVSAGSKVRLNFNNYDDMMHNFVIVKPGKAGETGEIAMKMGVEGQNKGWVPDTDLILFHTGLMQPYKDETIYFTAPSEPGDYMFVCTVPGHANSMQGILRVK